ncbi:MAG: Na/Pi cotransporter family protein [Candidatus Hydrogenedentota bacterium]
MYLNIIVDVVAGLGVFLLGMKNMSEGMQAIAGPIMRKMINRATSNRFMAVGMGALVTAIVQSSSVTTVMVVGLVNVGVMNISQAFGVIMGANIGTTITGWVLVLEVGKYGLPLLGIAALFYLFSKRDRVRYIALAFIGLGMVFFGLELMKNGFKPLRHEPEFIEWFARFSYSGSYLSVLKCALVGAILTAIVQSSSATLGITIGLATSGIIDYQTAAALVLGENIGTTITAFLASLGGSVNARRASYSHIMFNLIGVLWITAIFGFYSNIIVQLSENSYGGSPDYVELVVEVGEKVVVVQSGETIIFEDGHTFVNDDGDSVVVGDGNKEESFPYIAAAIAATHTGFNIANVIFFLPFVGAMSRLLMRIVPDKTPDAPGHLTYFDVRLVDTPGLGLEQSHKEIEFMCEEVENMMDKLRPIIVENREHEEVEKKIFHREEVLDLVQKEINQFLSQLLAGNVTQEVMEEGRNQIRMADEYESISDYIVAILKLNIKLRKEELTISDENRTELLDLHDHVNAYLLLINEGVRAGNADIVSKARTQGDAITHLMKEYRGNHIERVGTEHTSPLESLAITDILNGYRRIKDHALNIAEVVSGEK